jgi:POT family proton-dependent oligopeptide transporter
MNKYLSRKQSVLLLSLIDFFERFSYYGFRSIIVLYMIMGDNFNWEGEDARYYYFILFTLVSIAYFPMGILSDFILKQKNAIILGGLFLLVGYTLMLTNSTSLIWVSFGLIILGTSLRNDK